MFGGERLRIEFGFLPHDGRNHVGIQTLLFGAAHEVLLIGQWEQQLPECGRRVLQRHGEIVGRGALDVVQPLVRRTGCAREFHGQQIRLAAMAGAETQLGLGQIRQSGGFQQAGTGDAQSGFRIRLAGNGGLVRREGDGAQELGGLLRRSRCRNLRLGHALTAQYSVIVVGKLRREPGIEGARGGVIVVIGAGFGEAAQKIKRGGGRGMSGVSFQVLAQQFARVVPAANVRSPGDAPVA